MDLASLFLHIVILRYIELVREINWIELSNQKSRRSHNNYVRAHAGKYDTLQSKRLVYGNACACRMVSRFIT